MISHQDAMGQTRSPCKKMFDALLVRGGVAISIGLNSAIKDTLRKHSGISLTELDDADFSSESAIPDNLCCVIVGADAFDIDAVPRLRKVREQLFDHPDVCVIAVTSYMPGAFGDYAKMQGADLCITEDYLLNATKRTGDGSAVEKRWVTSSD